MGVKVAIDPDVHSCYNLDMRTDLKRGKAYGAWRHMQRRCYDKSDPGYKNYGERGISVCSQWLASFQSFYDHIGPPPTQKHTIDRIDNNGNYEPGNVRWATRHEQAANTRQSKTVEINGELMTTKAWCRRLGIAYGVVKERMRRGMSRKDALTAPRELKKYIEIGGIRKKLAEWMEQLGVTRKTLDERLKSGLTHEEALLASGDDGF